MILPEIVLKKGPILLICSERSSPDYGQAFPESLKGIKPMLLGGSQMAMMVQSTFSMPTSGLFFQDDGKIP